MMLSPAHAPIKIGQQVLAVGGIDNCWHKSGGETGQQKSPLKSANGTA
jgi:hypothetical protein